MAVLRAGLVCFVFLCALLSGERAALAEAPKPFPDFNAKRVKPPKAGQSKRITVQIEPQAAVAVDVTQTNDSDGTVAEAASALGLYPWFWSKVSPALSETGPGRLEPALVALSNAPSGQGVRTPRLEALRQVIDTYGTDILIATIGTDVSPALAVAVISVESSGQIDAVSGAGAQGLMQLMPATADRFGVTDAMQAKDNITGGVRFLDFLMDEFERDPVLVLAAYNAGENAIPAHDGVPPYAETRDYVPKVLAAFQVAKALCVTPPQLITDGCVFARP
ncbi:MAG: lytic transglycosylase domain-containing protein [Shimia sp.]|uniref:lytic transglycosylase domain-containing protein n=1 Tax=Shimia sp. TaxID=1954381 RepID=UPI004058C332